jgi:hypothetical protein
MKAKDPSAAAKDEFMHSLLEGQAAGAACVTAPGATTAVKSQEVEALLKEQGETILGASRLNRVDTSR